MKKEKKTRIDVRCTEKEKEYLKELARDRGMTTSEYIREKLFGKKMVVRYLDQGKYTREV
jgi:predicted DNA binding CopG/RHH family protein